MPFLTSSNRVGALGAHLALLRSVLGSGAGTRAGTGDPSRGSCWAHTLARQGAVPVRTDGPGARCLWGDQQVPTARPAQRSCCSALKGSRTALCADAFAASYWSLSTRREAGSHGPRVLGPRSAGDAVGAASPSARKAGPRLTRLLSPLCVRAPWTAAPHSGDRDRRARAPQEGAPLALGHRACAPPIRLSARGATQETDLVRLGGCGEACHPP